MYFPGTDRYYKNFNLPPHCYVRIRFFVLRNSGVTLTFQYYIDDEVYGYNYNSFPSSYTLGDIVTTGLIYHEDLDLSVAF